MKTRILHLRATIQRVCVKEKEHLLLGGAYGASAVWHHSAILTIAYGVVALAGIHIIRRREQGKHRDVERAYHPKHLTEGVK